jgi:hypothetical protein
MVLGHILPALSCPFWVAYSRRRLGDYDFDPVDGDDLGFKSLMASLSAIGADSLLTLPGVDEPTTASDYMARCLVLLRERDLPFDSAWSSAINRIQAPQGEGGMIEDPRVGALVLEERALLEEDRPRWQAAYERRSMTTLERGTCVARAWRRLEAGVPIVGTKQAGISPAG